MDVIRKNILRLCKPSLSQREEKEIADCFNIKDFWEGLEEFAEINHVHPLLYSRLQNISPAAVIPEKIRAIYLSNLKRNILLQKEFFEIKKAFIENKIALIPLKGISLINALYENIALRHMADMDILIKKKDMQNASFILKGMGYNSSPQKSAEHQILFLKKSRDAVIYIVELHWEIFPPRPYRFFLPDMWERNKLALEDSLVISCAHIKRHIRHLMFKDFCDILNILSKKDYCIDYNYLKEIAEKNHIKSSIMFSIWAVNKTFGANFPEPYKIGFARRFVFEFTFPQNVFFNRNRFRPLLLRLFMFDNLIDVILYIMRVSICERMLKRNLR